MIQLYVFVTCLTMRGKQWRWWNHGQGLFWIDRMINFDILWAIVHADLPNLIKQLEVIVENAESLTLHLPRHVYFSK